MVSHWLAFISKDTDATSLKLFIAGAIYAVFLLNQLLARHNLKHTIDGSWIADIGSRFNSCMSIHKYGNVKPDQCGNG